MIPPNIFFQNPIARMKQSDSYLRQHGTDIERLWRLSDQQSDGEDLGNGSLPSGSDDIEFEGELTADLAAPTSGWTGATTVTATQFIGDPTSVSDPIGFISAGLPDVTLINRDPLMAGINGSYCRWKPMQAANGLTEMRVTYVKVKTTVVTVVACSGGSLSVTDQDITG